MHTNQIHKWRTNKKKCPAHANREGREEEWKKKEKKKPEPKTKQENNLFTITNLNIW